MISGYRNIWLLLFGWTALQSGFSLNALRAQEAVISSQPQLAAPAPLPQRNPARIAPRSHPGQAETPEWSAQEVQSATDRCAMMLADTGVEYRFIAPIREGRCGTSAPIQLSSIGKARVVEINPPARVTCGLAATLSAWADGFLQPLARKHLDHEITQIRNVASYVCRNRYNADDKPISEHARANALDMAAFKTRSGEWIKVLDSWALPSEERPDREVTPSETVMPQPQQAPAEQQPDPLAEPEPEPVFGPQSAFLYEIHQGACTLFGTVLGPEANDAHKDHFHYDLAERKHGAYCQ